MFNGFTENNNWEKTESWLFLPIQICDPDRSEVHCDIYIKSLNTTNISSLEVWYTYNHKTLSKPNLNNFKKLFSLTATDVPEIDNTYDQNPELLIGFRYISESQEQSGIWYIDDIDSHLH